MSLAKDGISIGNVVDAYTAVLLRWWDEPEVYEAVSALTARDSQSKWWLVNN